MLYKIAAAFVIVRIITKILDDHLASQVYEDVEPIITPPPKKEKPKPSSRFKPSRTLEDSISTILRQKLGGHRRLGELTVYYDVANASTRMWLNVDGFTFEKELNWEIVQDQRVYDFLMQFVSEIESDLVRLSLEKASRN